MALLDPPQPSRRRANHPAEARTRCTQAGLAFARDIGTYGAIVAIVAHTTDAARVPSIVVTATRPTISMAGVVLFRRTRGLRVPRTHAIPIVATPLVVGAVWGSHAGGIVSARGCCP